MVKFLSKAAILALAASPFVAAQTSSECDPTKKTGCPADPGLNQQTYTVDFTKGFPSDWKSTFQTTTTDATNGAVFSISQYADGPTIASNWFIFFGKVECTMQAAPGAGIVSSFILISDDLDEIDVEMIGSQTTQVQSNYFGKGNTTTYDRGQFHNTETPEAKFHNYTIDWNSDKTTWAIDGNVVRTLNFADAVGGKNYPQTPMQIRLGNWVAGRPGNNQGTIDWAGGLADLSKGPFKMYVRSCSVTNYNPASSYSYGDQSGSFGSIQKSGSSPVSSSGSPTSSASGSTTTSSANSQGNEAANSLTATVITSIIGTGANASTYVTTICPTSTAGPYSNSTTTTTGGSSPSQTGVGAGNGTFISVGTPTQSTISSATISRPAQVTTNAASASSFNSVTLSLSLLMGLSLFF